MRRLIPVLACLLLAGCGRELDRPDCNANTAPDDYGRFIVNASTGMAQHASGSVWYRCMAGQSFRGKKCLGKPLELTRQEADSYLRDFSNKSGEVWRLPTKSEFKDITESRCDNPAMNPNVFPGLAVENYWLDDGSWHGERFGCSIFLYQGTVSCRQPAQVKQPILMVRD